MSWLWDSGTTLFELVMSSGRSGTSGRTYPAREAYCRFDPNKGILFGGIDNASISLAHCKLDRCQCTIRQRWLKLINCIILLGYDRGLKGHGVLDSISACHLIISACIRGSWSLCGRISMIRSCVRSSYTLRACFLNSRSL